MRNSPFEPRRRRRLPLARRPEDITLLDVIEAVNGPLPVGLPADNTLAELPRDWLGTSLEQVAEGTRRAWPASP